MIRNEILSPADAAERIRAGAVMVVAGAAKNMARLPKGNWIGGTTTHFMTPEGGRPSGDHVLCSTFEGALGATVRTLPADCLARIPEGYKPGGVSFILLPSLSAAHCAFGIEARAYDGLFAQPLLGWVAGAECLSTKARVVNGATRRRHENSAVVLHIDLPETTRVDFEVLNFFQQAEDDGERVMFPETGFAATEAIIAGKDVNLATYLMEHQIDTRLPLIGDHAGELVNVSIRRVDTEAGRVEFYAPVVAGVEYRLATKLGDYGTAFSDRIAIADMGQFSCNSIVNFLHAGYEGGVMTGPVSDGEIAYILQNQTLVRCSLSKL